jgi:hypothetical protein
MSMREPDFQGEVVITAKIHAYNPNLNAELQAVATALASDPTTHDATIEAPPAALRMGPDKTRTTNDLLLLVNIGKGGNLSKASMIAALDSVAGVVSPPGLVDVPYASANASPPIVGTLCSCTTGNWVGTPTSYAYQWTRDGTNISLATSATYTLVAADIGGHQIRCVVTATNATGSTAAPPSNFIST